MPTYTDEQKKQRKITIKSREYLNILDGGVPPPQPFTIVHHPRAFNKPLSCLAGKHQWTNKVVMGVPFLYCKKCGAGAPRDVYHDVLTEREKRVNVPNPLKNVNKVDWIEEIVEKMNARSRR